MKRILIIMIIGTLVTFILTACTCEHEWNEATCEIPKTCSVCGETDGNALGHEWREATCEIPKTCSACGETEGELLPHQWMEEAKICKTCGLDERSVDERFMDSLAKGMDARWALVNADEGKDVTTKSDWEQYFDAEYNEIIEFENASFENPDLEKWAKVYIDTIVRSKEALAYYSTNQWDTKYSVEINNERTNAIYEIYTIAPIPVYEENEDILIGMVSEGEVIKFTYVLFEDMEFKLSEDETDTYESIVENTCSIGFSYFSIDIDLIDEDGVTVETKSDFVENWNPGEKIRFSFWSSEEFESMNVVSASWNY